MKVKRLARESGAVALGCEQLEAPAPASVLFSILTSALVSAPAATSALTPVPAATPARALAPASSRALTRALVLAFALMLAVVLTCVGTTRALAADQADVTVQGAQTTLTEQDLQAKSADLRVLNLSGAAGSTVYLNVNDNGEPLSQYLPHQLGEGGQTGANVADVFKIHLAKGINQSKLETGAYTVEAYDKRGGTLLFQGTVYGVWARLGGGSSSIAGSDDGTPDDGAPDDGTPDAPNPETLLIGTRTAAANGAFTFTPPATIYRGTQAYRLASSTPSIQDNLAYFDYEAYDATAADAVDGVISYVDQDGTLLQTETIPGIPAGGQKQQTIPATITVDGKLYRTLAFQDAVTATNPGQTSFVVECRFMAGAPYLAKIRMVDENGTVLASDSVNVEGTYQYVAPTYIYKVVDVKGETRTVAYELQGTATYELNATADLAQVVNGQRTITVKYAAHSLEEGQVLVTFNQLDGQGNAEGRTRLLGTATATVSADDPTATPAETIQVEGATYELAADAAAFAYTYGSKATPVVDAYYVPQGYTAPQPYTVTVNYVNFADGTTVASQEYDSSADEPLTSLPSPQTFDNGGATYVRLPGQDAAIAHNFYSGLQTYTVYYRDSNDVLSGENVIERTRVVYRNNGTGAADGTGSNAANGTGANGVNATNGANQQAGAANQQAGAADAANAAVPTVTLNPATGYNAVAGAGDGTLLNNRGVDSNTERIDEDETPLAQMQGDGEGGAPSDEGGFIAGGIAAAVVLVLAAIAGVWWFAAARRRNNNRQA